MSTPCTASIITVGTGRLSRRSARKHTPTPDVHRTTDAEHSLAAMRAKLSASLVALCAWCVTMVGSLGGLIIVGDVSRERHAHAPPVRATSIALGRTPHRGNADRWHDTLTRPTETRARGPPDQPYAAGCLACPPGLIVICTSKLLHSKPSRNRDVAGRHTTVTKRPTGSAYDAGSDPGNQA